MQLDFTWCQSNTFSLELFDYLLQMHSHDGSFNLTDGMVRVQSFHAYPRASLAALDSFFYYTRTPMWRSYLLSTHETNETQLPITLWMIANRISSMGGSVPPKVHWFPVNVYQWDASSIPCSGPFDHISESGRKYCTHTIVCHTTKCLPS